MPKDLLEEAALAKVLNALDFSGRTLRHIAASGRPALLLASPFITKGGRDNLW